MGNAFDQRMGTEDLSANSSTDDYIFILLFLVLLVMVLDSAMTFKIENWSELQHSITTLDM